MVQTVNNGAKVTAPTVPTRTGFTFGGWFADGTQTAFDFNTPITANTILTAKWTQNQTQSPAPAPNQKVTKVTLNKTKLTLGIKDKFTLKAASDSADAVASVTWTIDTKGKKFVTLNAKTGMVKGKKKGKATITVTVTSKDGSQITQTCKITVKPAPTKKTKISVSKKLNLKVKGKKTLKPKVKGNFGCSTFKFTSKNKKIAKVDAEGTVTGVKKGTTKITVATYNKKAKTTVNVTVK